MNYILEAIISTDRLGTYRKAVGHDVDRAIALYAWNMKLSASFMPLLCSAEICLRNLTVPRVASVYGPNWWQSNAFIQLSESKSTLKRAEGKIAASNNPIDSGRMTAELNFGFWQKMLLPKYQEPLWSQLHDNFPDLPTHVDQTALYNKCGIVRDLRNRISHHEPIFQRNTSQDYAECLELISWLSTAKAVWIKPHCNVMALMRQKP